MTSEFRELARIPQARLILLIYRSVIQRNIAIQAAVLERPREVCRSVLHEKPTSRLLPRVRRCGVTTESLVPESNIAECANKLFRPPFFSLSTTPYSMLGQCFLKLYCETWMFFLSSVPGLDQANSSLVAVIPMITQFSCFLSETMSDDWQPTKMASQRKCTLLDLDPSCQICRYGCPSWPIV